MTKTEYDVLMKALSRLDTSMRKLARLCSTKAESDEPRTEAAYAVTRIRMLCEDAEAEGFHAD